MEFLEQKMQEENYTEAVKRVKKIKGFYVHFIVYIVISLMMLGVKMYYTSPSESVFRYQNFTTFFFWGIGIVAHASAVFIPQLKFGKQWEEKKIKEIMERKKNNELY
ncbi:2TM domain-containing protein [Aurantibacter sp.]|uniref:2TM domain-containing protein n=1 Tax=Aurantibacter sp. TaxID=2807103 RepID=UPI0035C87607